MSARIFSYRRTYLASLVLAVLLAGCNDPTAPDWIKSAGPTVNQTRTIPLLEGKGIRELLLEDDVALILVADTFPTLSLSGPRNLLDKVATDFTAMAGGGYSLRVYNRNRFNWVRAYGQRIQLRLPARGLHRLTQTGYGAIICEDTLRGPRLEINLYGASTTQLACRANELALDGNGKGTCTLTGRSIYLYAGIAAYFLLDATGFQVPLADVTQKAITDATMHVTDSCHAVFYNVGNIRILGNPKLAREGDGKGKFVLP